MKTAKQLIVSGKVQGVGFRYFAQLTAADYDICGWVRNLENGAVEIHAEGTEEKMQQFISALKKGNSFAKVASIKDLPAAAKEFTSFKITY